MEQYKNTKPLFAIVGMAKTNEKLSFTEGKVPDIIKISLHPYIAVYKEKKMANTTIVVFFVDDNNREITNRLTFQMFFVFDKLPLELDGENVKINDNDVILSILDTTIGGLRTVLYEWLDGSELQNCLQPVDMEELYKQTQVSFSNIKEKC